MRGESGGCGGQKQARIGMNEQLATYVKDRSEALGLSQTELCRRAGVSRQTLHTLLLDTSKLPGLQTVASLADALQVHPMRLLQIICDERMTAPEQVRAQRSRRDRTAFLRDVSYPDGALVAPGQRFTKTWELQNVGSVVWEGRLLRCMDEDILVYSRTGEQLQLAVPLRPAARQLLIPTTLPGQAVQLSMDFTAPSSPGSVLSYWKTTFADGRLCFPAAHGVWVKVQVSTLASAASA